MAKVSKHKAKSPKAKGDHAHGPKQLDQTPERFSFPDWFIQLERSAQQRAEELAEARGAIDKAAAIRDGLIPPPWKNKSRKARRSSKSRTIRIANAARRKSCNYIAGLMKASPEKPTHSKEDLRAECKRRFKATWRDVNQAWKKALEDVPHAEKAWTSPGSRR